MGIRGPAPAPTKILEGRGNRRAKVQAKLEPQYEPGASQPPERLDDVAKEKWFELVAQMIASGIFTTIDQTTLARYCEMWSDYIRDREFIRANGISFNDAAGYPKAYPEVSSLDKTQTKMMILEREFGMTPSSRSRIQSPKRKAEKKTKGKGSYFSDTG